LTPRHGGARLKTCTREESMAKKRRTLTAHRDAVTGQWVTPGYAQRHPKTRVKETIRNPKKR
jgi:hypothetical protein